MAVVDDLVHVAAGELFGLVAEGAGAGLVDERQPALQVDAANAVTHRLQDQFALSHGHVQRLFGLVLFGHVHAMVQHKRPFAVQVHAAAAERNATVNAVAAPHRDRPLPLVPGLQRAQALLESGRAGCVQHLGHGAAHQVLRAIAQSFRRECIERGQTAFHGAREHKSQAAFHHLAVARLA